MPDFNDSPKTAVACFAAIFFVGVTLIGVGLFVLPVLPYFQLDVVLNRTELADQEKKDATLKLLMAARGNEWLFCTVAGVTVSVLSAVGLWQLQRKS